MNKIINGGVAKTASYSDKASLKAQDYQHLIHRLDTNRTTGYTAAIQIYIPSDKHNTGVHD